MPSTELLSLLEEVMNELTWHNAESKHVTRPHVFQRLQTAIDQARSEVKATRPEQEAMKRRMAPHG